jgi:hypothetical protein
MKGSYLRSLTYNRTSQFLRGNKLRKLQSEDSVYAVEEIEFGLV